MNNPIKSLALALALLVAFCLMPSANAGQFTPYKDKALGEIIAVTNIPGGVRLDFAVVGNATQLGKMTTLGFLDVNLTDFSFTGENTLTAANGDQIFLTISGQLTPTVAPSVFIIQLQTVFQSGTGRFENVKGGFDGLGTLNVTPGFVGSTFAGTGDGLIAKANKKSK